MSRKGIQVPQHFDLIQFSSENHRHQQLQASTLYLLHLQSTNFYY